VADAIHSGKAPDERNDVVRGRSRFLGDD